jgi:multiple sugar transport system ATP-binding protein
LPALTFQDVTKKFGTNTIIESFDAQVEEGEFLVLLGPSGCGKSTLLRMIAGLTDITSGTLAFDGVRANEWDVRTREIAFVFQSYALYPHMTVRGNIAFPLVMKAFKPWHHLPIVNSIVRRRLMKSPEIAEKTQRLAVSLELDPLLDRRPALLSGGQRQRVALARALIRDPALYLLDEPLSNLDAKLRTQMRAEISNLHRMVGKTFIYVTHDQVEAMTMATRIIIMNKGVVQQVGTPEEIYSKPANTFVARFVGAPPMNLISVTRRGNTLVGENDVVVPIVTSLGEREQAILGIRPEKVQFRSDDSGALRAEVAIVERLGSESLIGCHIGRVDRTKVTDNGLLYVKVQGSAPVQVGDSCSLTIDPLDVIWFDPKTDQRIVA